MLKKHLCARLRNDGRVHDHTHHVAGRRRASLPQPAAAADPPITQRSATGVTADALPTVQINGVVWDQAIVDNTVYAGGDSSPRLARPAPAPAPTRPRDPTCCRTTSRPGVMTASPRRSTASSRCSPCHRTRAVLYVGGSFTSVERHSAQSHRRVRHRHRCRDQLLHSEPRRPGAGDHRHQQHGVRGWHLLHGQRQRTQPARRLQRRERRTARLGARPPTTTSTRCWSPRTAQQVIVGGALRHHQRLDSPRPGCRRPDLGRAASRRSPTPWSRTTAPPRPSCR